MSTSLLTLTNKVIEESGVSLASLTSGDFATTTDSMQRRAKNWTIDAWKNIQTDRRHWHFNRKRGVYILQPRIEFYDGSATAETTFDNAYLQDTNENWEYTVNGSVYVESGTFVAGTAVGWFNIEDEDGLLPIEDAIKTTDTVANTYMASILFDTFTGDVGGYVTSFPPGCTATFGAYTGIVIASSEAGDNYTMVVKFTTSAIRSAVTALLIATPSTVVTSDSAASVGIVRNYLSNTSTTGTLRVLGWGRYRLDTVGPDSDADSAITDVQEVDIKSFRISPYAGATTDDFSDDRQFVEVEFVNPEVWKCQGYGINKQLGCPTHFTIDHDGKYVFFPQPEKAYALVFDYWKTPQMLSAHGDLVEGIADAYTDVIVWKAVEYWAMFDESSNNVRRAKAMFAPLYRKLLRDYSDNIKFPQGVGGKSFG